MDKDILAFTTAVGAKVPEIENFKLMFKRSNYFTFNGKFLVVKISRSKRPFWGVGKDFIDFLNGLHAFYLVLLTSEREGWVFSKAEINRNIGSGRWGLGQDGQYKINWPLPDANAFHSRETFKAKLP